MPPATEIPACESYSYLLKFSLPGSHCSTVWQVGMCLARREPTAALVSHLAVRWELGESTQKEVGRRSESGIESNNGDLMLLWSIEGGWRKELYRREV